MKLIERVWNCKDLLWMWIKLIKKGAADTDVKGFDVCEEGFLCNGNIE